MQGVSPIQVLETLVERIQAYGMVQPPVWIRLIGKEAILDEARKAINAYPDKMQRPSLFGVPFSVKDNIDVQGLPTTTACPPLTRRATKSAPIVDRLRDQGAILIGKTNLEQLATGMTGCRSPYGTLSCYGNIDFIVGGSSSGSCISVRAGLVSFSLGSDTAGSGRIPAAFNGIVGWKATKGTVSCSGITPASQSQDCVAVLANNVSDARTVWDVIKGYDPDDIYAKPSYCLTVSPKEPTHVFAVPPAEALEACSQGFRRMFGLVISHLVKYGWQFEVIDWSAFEDAGKLLYEGTFVAERIAGLPDAWLENHQDQLHPDIREIFIKTIENPKTAVDVFKDLHAQQQ